ncbi:MAG: P1 family peptidase [Christensenellales bacterium]|jgi:L-aminopeptidase/D-esterase-like protein
MYKGNISDIDGIICGHAQYNDAMTGCTTIICEGGAVASVDVRGAAPGTRETDVFTPGNLINTAHAIVLCGGSAFGLDAAGGVMAELEARGIGIDTGFAKVPIVAAAVLFDLGVGRADIRPDANMGRQAARAAGKSAAQGRVGAGIGASVGKAYGPQYAMAGGIGMATVAAGEALVSAIIAVNAWGDVLNHNTLDIIAGARDESGKWLDSYKKAVSGDAWGLAGTNTVIGVIATDAVFDSGAAKRIAQAGHDGLAMAIRPSHTMFDGDTLFSLCTGKVHADINAVCAAAAEAAARAVENAVTAERHAKGE